MVPAAGTASGQPLPRGLASLAVHPFRAAIEAHDIAAAVDLLDDDVVFRSPVVFTPYRGRLAVGQILHLVADVFEDLHYVREIGASDAADHALIFRARIGDRQVEGCDLLHTTPAGTIDELTVMVRPLQAVQALADAVKARLATPPSTTTS